MTLRRRIQLTCVAAASLVAFVIVWGVSLASDQCGNADTVECTPIGWVLLYGWMALGLFSACLLLLVAGLWLVAALRGRAQKP